MCRWTKFSCLSSALLAILLLGGCGSQPVASGALNRPAEVARIEILTNSLPLEITAVAHGNLPDGCTKISGVDQKREGSVFRVTVMTTRPADIMCTQALVPFRRSIPLSVVGLRPGIYSVEVNGVRDSFILR